MKKDYGGIILQLGCSNKCIFCGNTINYVFNDLHESLQKVEQNILEFKKEGIKKIEISGGDPIEYENIPDLIKHIKELGFIFIQLSTHGRRLKDIGFAEQLIKSGVTKLRIPLYGSNAATHDAITQTKGSFDETYNGLINVRKIDPKLQIQVSSLITQQNKDELIDILSLVKSMGITDFYFSIPCVSNKDYSYYVPLKDLGQYVKKVYDYAISIKYDLRFMEIPFCIFGLYNKCIENLSTPPNLGKYCQPPDKFKTPVKDMPSYRLKRKFPMCEECICTSYCDGFFINDVDIYGIGDLRPIK